MREAIDRLTEAEHALDKLVDKELEDGSLVLVATPVLRLWRALLSVRRARWLVLRAFHPTGDPDPV